MHSLKFSNFSLCRRSKKKWSEFLNDDISINDLKMQIENQGESKILQLFGNVWHNSTIPGAFAEVMKVTNHTGL